MEENQVTKKNEFELAITKELKKFNPIEKSIKKMVKEYKELTISGVDDKEGYEEVRKAIAFTRTTKTGIEKKRKEIKEPAIVFGKEVDAQAKKITEMLLPIYEELKSKKENIDNEKEKLKEQKRIEQEKIIQERSVKLVDMGLFFDGVYYIFGSYKISTGELSVYNDTNFDAFVNNVSAAIKEDNKIKAEEAKEEAKMKARLYEINKFNKFLTEDDIITPEDIRDTSDDDYLDFIDELKLRQTKYEEEKRIEEEEKKKLLMLHDERITIIAPYIRYQKESINLNDIAKWTEEEFKEMVEVLKGHKVAEERRIAAIEEERKELEIERKRIAEESKKLAAERVKIEKRREAEAKKKADMMEKKRLAALKPDKKKLELFAEQLTNIEQPKLKTPEAKEILSDAITSLLTVSAFILNSIK